MMENSIAIKDVIVDLFCSLHDQPLDVQVAVIDAMEDFVREWLLRQRLPCTMFKLWKTNFCGSTNLCNVLLRPSDLLLLFAGSRLLPQLFSFHLTSASDEFKCVPGLPYSLQNSSSTTCREQVDIVEVQNLATSEQNHINLEGAVPDYILVKPLNCELTGGNLQQLTATVSETNPIRSTFSECTEVDSVDNVSYDGYTSDHKSEADWTGAALDVIDNTTEKPCESAPATRGRKPKFQSLSGEVEIEVKLRRQSKKKSSTERIVKKVTNGRKKSERAATSVKKESHRTRAKRTVKSVDQTETQPTDDSQEKVKDGLPLNGLTVCEICGAVVKCLKSHMLKHSDPKHKCPHCPFMSRQLQSVIIHIRRRHTNYRPHLCEECGKTFVKSTLLKEHVKEKHAMLEKERRFPCSTCNYKAYSKSILARHEAKHAKDRKPEFRCEECGARLMTVNSLKEHIRLSHSEARPFPCAVCGFATKSAKRLRSHMRTHGDKTFECGVCAKKFTLRPQLIRHQLVHSGDKPFACPCCSYKCAIVENLRKHCRAVHRIIYPPKKRDVRDELCAPNVVVSLPGATVASAVTGSRGSDNGSVGIGDGTDVDSCDVVRQ